MTPKDAIAFLDLHGIVLESARGPVPNLAEAVAGERIRGNWWGIPKGRTSLLRPVLCGPRPMSLFVASVEG